MNQARYAFVDAARGLAMLFVFLSHFGQGYFADDPSWPLELVGMVASPTFVVLSGILLGLIYRTSPVSYSTFRLKLIDRGLFLLIIGHLLCGIAHAWLVGGVIRGLQIGFITDAIGISIILGPLVVARLQIRPRLLFAFVLYLMSWVIAITWLPHGTAGGLLKDALFGSFNPAVIPYVFPAVPWFAVYLAGTCLGELMGVAYMAREQDTIPTLLRRTALGCFLVAIAIKGTYKLITVFSPLPGESPLYALTNPLQRIPPSPVYIGLFVTIGLLIISGVAALHQAGRASTLLGMAATIGRASLFAFLLQYYCYLVAIYWLRTALPGPAALWFAASVAGIYAACSVWDRHGCSRWFTVGFRGVTKRWPIGAEPTWTRT